MKFMQTESECQDKETGDGACLASEVALQVFVGVSTKSYGANRYEVAAPSM